MEGAARPSPHVISKQSFELVTKATTWAILLLGIGLGGSVLANSRLLCSVGGHRRSGYLRRFSYEDQQWISNCKRCGVLLTRRPDRPLWSATAGFDKSKPLKSVAETQAEREPAKALPNKSKLVAKSVETTLDREPNRVEGAPSDILEDRSVDASLLRENRTHTIVQRLLDDILGGNAAPPPGARGALFFVVDELRASPGMDEQTRRAEEFSIMLQQLERALQRGDENEATFARRELKALAGEWKSSWPCSEL
jgi:hypothetical protein